MIKKLSIHKKIATGGGAFVKIVELESFSQFLFYDGEVFLYHIKKIYHNSYSWIEWQHAGRISAEFPRYLTFSVI